MATRIKEGGIKLWYCYSPNNSNWGEWTLFSNDNSDGWSKEFIAPEDNTFINQSANRKQALKNKFEAVFNMIEKNNYLRAIQRLEFNR